MRKIRPILVLMLFSLLPTASMAVQDVNLSYHPQPDAEWTMNLIFDAEVPVVGAKHLEVSYALVCEGADENGAIIRINIPAIDVDGTVIDPTQATFTLSPWGDVSRLSSDQLADPFVGALLRNVGMIFPKLPGGEVSVGAGWTAREVIHLPPMKKGKVKLPSKIRLDGGFNYLGTKNGREEISVNYKEADGEIKVRLKGTCLYDTEAGVVTSAKISGTIKVKKFFQWFTIPVIINVSMR